MSTTTKVGAGRPPTKVLTDHFNQLEKQTNKSNRWFYQCKYCGSEPNATGSHIENRDNKPLKHLQLCDKAPQSACTAARTHLATKAIELLPDSISNGTSASTKNLSSTGTQGFQAGQATSTALKHPIVEAFGAIEREKADMQRESGLILDLEIELDGNEVLEGKVYDWSELEAVDKGTKPTGFIEEISILDNTLDGQWNINTL